MLHDHSCSWGNQEEVKGLGLCPWGCRLMKSGQTQQEENKEEQSKC